LFRLGRTHLEIRDRPYMSNGMLLKRPTGVNRDGPTSTSLWSGSPTSSTSSSSPSSWLTSWSQWSLNNTRKLCNNDRRMNTITNVRSIRKS
jgi:hypothetical protein